jgi:nucleoside-diphosphate-sugar epimerase
VARTILVVGGTRFVGRLFVLRALARGDRVTLFNRGNHAHPFGDRVELVRGDRGTDDFARLSDRSFDAAVDFAAYVERDVARAVEVLGGRVGRYLFVSTGQVYLVREQPAHTQGMRGGFATPAREEDYDGPVMACPDGEADRAEWAYGIGKRACEDLLLRSASALPSIRLRIPMVNGPRDFYRRIERYVHRMLDGGPLLVPDASRRVRHVDGTEVAATIDRLLDDDRALGQAFNQAQDETPTLAELLARIGDELGVRPHVLEVPDLERYVSVRAASPFSGRWMSFLDPSKIRALGVGHAPLAVTVARAMGELLAHLPEPPDDYRAQRAAELSAARAAR